MPSKNRLALISLCVVSLFNTGCCCDTVKPGYVGLIVPYYGSKQTKTEYETCYGRVWYNPLTTEIHTFPTYLQQVVWSKDDETDGKPGDQSITFNTSDNNTVNCDVAFAYAVKEDMVSKIFREQRRDIDAITDIYLRSRVRDVFVQYGSQFHVQGIMSADKEKFLELVKQDLKTELEPKGYTIDMVSIVGAVRVDQRVTEAINSTIAQQQKALEADAKVKQSEAEARQAVAVAKGKSDAEIAEAEGKSAARLLISEAEAKANKVLQESLSPDLVKYQALLKWDGKLPTMMSASTPLPFINVDPGK